MKGNFQVRFGGGRWEKQTKLLARRLPNAEAEQLLHNFTIHRCEDVDHAVDQSGGYHWQIYATLNR